MKINKQIAVLLMGFLSCISTICLAQGQFSISKPHLEIKGDQLIITYNIVNSKPGENYDVNLTITDSNGNKVDALSLSGDLGLNVEGGRNKRIIWEFTTDEVTDEIEIIVKLMAELQQAELPFPPPDTPPVKTTYTRSSLILQSVALPGLGMTRLKEKPHWIMGAVGYGLVANGAYFWIKSNNTYDNEYNNEDYTYDNVEDRQDAYARYETERTISIASFCGAGAIWLTNLVLIYRASGKVQKSPYTNLHRDFNIYPVYDYNTRSPMISMTFRF